MFCHKSVEKKYYKSERVLVSRLIINVLCGTLTVKDALLRFPKDVDDSSIISAWHALSHYAADEDIQKSDKVYNNVQYEYLEFIAFSLRDNKDLPWIVYKVGFPPEEFAIQYRMKLEKSSS